MTKALLPQGEWVSACGDGCCMEWAGGLRPADHSAAVKVADDILAAGGKVKFRRRRNGVALMVFRVDAWGETAPSAGVVFLIDIPR